MTNMQQLLILKKVRQSAEIAFGSWRRLSLATDFTEKQFANTEVMISVRGGSNSMAIAIGC